MTSAVRVHRRIHDSSKIWAVGDGGACRPGQRRALRQEPEDFQSESGRKDILNKRDIRRGGGTVAEVG